MIARLRFGDGKPRIIAMSGRRFKPLRALGTGGPRAADDTAGVAAGLVTP